MSAKEPLKKNRWVNSNKDETLIKNFKNGTENRSGFFHINIL